MRAIMVQDNVQDSPVKKFYERYVKEQAEIQKHKEWLASLTPTERRELKKKRGRPRTKKYYFDINVERAIIAYNIEGNQNMRNKVYKDFIWKAFDKLAESIIHTFKFYYLEVEKFSGAIEKLSYYKQQ